MPEDLKVETKPSSRLASAKKFGATVAAAGFTALGIGAETAQAHPVSNEGSVPAATSPNAVGAEAAGPDSINGHHHLISPNRIQTDPSSGDIGGKGGDPLAPDQNGKTGEPGPLL